jgi:hypothetical protein
MDGDHTALVRPEGHCVAEVMDQIQIQGYPSPGYLDLFPPGYADEGGSDRHHHAPEPIDRFDLLIGARQDRKHLDASLDLIEPRQQLLYVRLVATHGMVSQVPGLDTHPQRPRHRSSQSRAAPAGSRGCQPEQEQTRSKP